MKRHVQPEWLDALPPHDPRAICSRHDLHRVNGWMRNHSLMADVLQRVFPGQPPPQLTEIGAGDGDFILQVAKRLQPSWTKVNATLLDRQASVTASTLQALAAIGWQTEVVTADIFDWTPKPDTGQVVIANLFLHHFNEVQLFRLLQKISSHANLLIAVEPQRFAFPALGGLLLALIGSNDVTRHDGVASIRAGFAGRELSEAWPDRKNWRLTEQRSGLFSHLFIAQRLK